MDLAARNQETSPRGLAEMIDAHRWSRYQILVLILASSAILLDGFDNQALGFAVPLILKEWGLSRAALGPALAASQLGMLIGTIAGGLGGDRFGRKTSLLASMLIFGTATFCIAWSHSTTTLAILRLVAGLGLGAAFPNVAALVAEYTPTRHRGLAVTAGIVSVPLGGTVGGLIASWILPTHGWPALFILSGILPLATALLLFLFLPESIAFLASRPAPDHAALDRICSRIGIDMPDTLSSRTALERGHADPAAGSGFTAIVAKPFLRDTMLLWTAFFFCLASIYIAFSWLPALLVSSGFDVATASQGLAAFNMGGVVAALGTGWLIGRAGSRGPMTILAASAVLSASLIAIFPVTSETGRSALLWSLALEGACVNGVQTTLYALAAQIYPPNSRATGVGAAAGLGRVGAMLSSMLGGVVISVGGVAGFHALTAISMAIVAAALFFIHRHFPSRRAVQIAGAR